MSGIVISDVERVVPQHHRPDGLGHEDDSPDQQGGDGSQAPARNSTANHRRRRIADQYLATVLFRKI